MVEFVHMILRLSASLVQADLALLHVMASFCLVSRCSHCLRAPASSVISSSCARPPSSICCCSQVFKARKYGQPTKCQPHSVSAFFSNYSCQASPVEWVLKSVLRSNFVEEQHPPTDRPRTILVSAIICLRSA